MENTYYDILGVKQTATESEIKDAYRHLISIYHPDKNNGDISAVKLSQIINKAYEILKDPEKRTHYDEYLVQNKMAHGPLYSSENQYVPGQNYSDRSDAKKSRNENEIKKHSGMGPGFWIVIYIIGGGWLSTKFGHASWILVIFCVIVIFLIARASSKEDKKNR
jgi:DnaJ-class molecular chaperone